MERKEIIEKLNDIFIDVMDNDEISIAESTTSNDIEEWDSLTHVHLVVEIQRAFGINFSAKEMMNWNNVGEMVDSIIQKKS